MYTTFFFLGPLAFEGRVDLDVYNLFPEPAPSCPDYMPGRLKACWSEWMKLKPNALVTSIILN